MSRKFIQFFLFAVLAMVVYVPTSYVSAKKTVTDAPSMLGDVVDRTGLAKNDIPTYTGTIIKGVLTSVGIIFFILMFYAGFYWMTARGDEERIKKARQTIVGASIGLVIIVGSYALTSFMTTRVIKGISNTGNDSGADTADYTKVGCCFDKVRHPSDNPTELRATMWEWRITTQASCQTEGEKTTSFDEIFGSGTWQFQSVSSKNECQALYDTFCTTQTCYELSF
ncbi:MAG: hypothetical protein UV82_C0012G0026 [Candidatus Magasanikbacteria bacterium GW2011_GWD2_43_18]|uniref:Uncharacterized protein n=1 Tax=Candidatus Magasanikbacteria bacterium GW2011_GWE2_42_7 TaxID=1619052 RepID=A0A0G1DPN6_9BACT|nr:MAG: hypothetical protein UV18_C0005G0113 [Candidatus Magasanikbacteria bacterium GW2011_GWC2_42_27]KKS72791.1 MAG: hypothetical protein UV42_C0004G0003 [Candidatus Magasanikbacteria bacterium GW2011_GWE2_42_7]KKT04041.1 MAG: hypothetical protein UV82_C0012G0026 [Candidatus Magasanikbacteria bacterium GW2011_GWD2_43_18]KKT25951.1 MAG: hypothetical protein UW10_C0003G0112 [Candidatus Magasanikbacteria bacterium GW2011_GWA2_43_9]HBB37926.1 hypothetical protein [Candidatus Magasanikbacteria bac